MEYNEENLVISYTFDHKEFKETNLHPTSLAGALCCYIIPFVVVLFVELILLIVCLIFGFSEMRIFYMIFIAAAYCLFIFLFTLLWLIILRVQWKNTTRLPLEHKWIFTKEGVFVDKTYTKTVHIWSTIQSIQIWKRLIFFGTIKNRLFQLGFGTLPIRFLTEKQFEELIIVLQKYLDENIILYKTEKQKLKFKVQN